ncbi:unnamed protein product [Linum trigynum]|uniref:Late embryogenesis abundant protein LEA-2 subgroup domain-containing protein n=1 Tax=Linum trigynum TaxID=586398 RepID=A0AAV2DH92_9ROSI
MSDGTADTCCRCCSSFILTSGLTALFLWLSLRTSTPKLFLQNISIPSLNRSHPIPPPANSSSSSGALLSFDLRLENPNKDKGVFYDAVKVSFYSLDGGNNKSIPLGNFTIPPFYQGHQKKATKSGSLNGTTGAAAILRRGNDSSSAPRSFRVDIATRVRYKIIFFKTKRHRIAVGADFQVNDQGTKVNSRDVRLKTTPFCWEIGVLVLSVLVF